ncbi:MAG: WD40/YVTN/BNR-like repeat-containing protein [Phycisphaerae bacterium]
MKQGHCKNSLRVALIAALTLGTWAVRSAADAPEQEEDKPMSAATFEGLKLRPLGPALMSGRVGDFAVDPNNRAHYYVAVCSGGVWKTTNGGTTWTPLFDKQGSYSIGCVELDPKNPNVVWVGTGENNSQRSVSFGDGVYRSRDGGKTWQNLGLGQSEHIGMIAIDPRDSDVVYVAAQGPLWRAGGDRGLYKTSDGGQSWERILHVSDDTGVNEVHLDPRYPDVIYATAYQRRRRVWTLINGGPESGIHKSSDGGATWRLLTEGLPKVDMGRIGLDISPADPDVLYAIIEAADKKGGIFRSTDRGETWTKRCDYMSSSPQYYNELVADPNLVDRFYSLDTYLHVTRDGGKTMKKVPNKFRHVDDHALWIDPADSNYLLVGCDGGIYESFDRGENWHFKSNLPVTQFYRVTVDNAEPFYYVYGGTQDNNTVGGPSRTFSPGGIANEDWFTTVGGDGFETQIDPTDPNIVYSQWQYGGLVRHDRRSGQIVDIKPREAPDEEPYRWNWDSPLIISPHNPKRLYFGAQKLFRSDDRGDSWTAISGDLSRGLDRNALGVMGKIQSADAVSKNMSTSIYGNTVALAESPLAQGLLYVGTDDGLVHITEDDGQNWRTVSVFPTVPDITYVSCLTASLHDADTVFAAFDNHKNGDFKPYVLKSADRGHTWTSLRGDLPDREIVYSVQQDHVKSDLLFAGTEFGLYFTVDQGQHWIKLTGNMPTVAVRDIDVQRRENDLVLATFGRSFYVLDDYAPLRQVNETFLEQPAALFPIKNAWRYIRTTRLGGWSGRGSQGASFYTAPNPPFGAVFTYYLKEKITTRKEQRQEAEKKAVKAGKPIRYPTLDELRLEDEEKEPQVVLTVRDEAGQVLRRITASRDKGIHRAAWDLRYPSAVPTRLKPPEDRPDWMPPPAGPLALPGTYTATLSKEVDGQATELAGPVRFEVVPLDRATFEATDRGEVLAFRKKIANLQRAVRGAVKAADEAQTRLDHLRKAYLDTPAAPPTVLAEIHDLQQRLNVVKTKLSGDKTRGKRNEPTPPSILERVQNVVDNQWHVTSPPTRTHLDAYRYAGQAFTQVLSDLRKLMEEDLTGLEDNLQALGAPWTPGRVPTWQME